MKVVSIVSVVEDPAALRPQYGKLFGRDAITDLGDCLRFRVGEGAWIDMLSASGAVERGLATANTSCPYMPAMTLAVRDLDGTRAVLRRNRVAFADLSDSIRVAAPQACGVTIYFTTTVPG